MYHELIGGNLELPLQGALFVNALYPGRCPGLWKNCPVGAQSMSRNMNSLSLLSFLLVLNLEHSSLYAQC